MEFRVPCANVERGILSSGYRGGCVTTTTEKESLLAQLTAEHRRLDQQLQELEKRRALTPSERDQIAKLKKQKLLTKDRIARLS